MTTRAGAYDRVISVETLTTTQAADGQPIETWTEAYTLKACIESQAAMERFVAQQRFATVDTLFRVRWNQAITPTMSPRTHRIVYRDRVFELLGVVEIGRKVEAHLPTVGRAEEGTP